MARPSSRPASTSSPIAIAGGSPPATSPTRSRHRSPGSSATSGRGCRSPSGPPAAACAGSSPWAARRAARLQAGTDGELRSGGLDVGVGRHHPGRRLTGRRRDAHPGSGDGCPGRHRRRSVEQGTARLPGLRGAPAGGAPPPATVRGAGPRRRHAATAGRGGPGRARRPGRPRGRDRHRPAHARLRRPGRGDPGAAGRSRPDPGRCAGRSRGAVPRGRRVRAASPAASSSRRPSSGSRTGRWSPCPWATSSASSEAELVRGAPRLLRLRSAVMPATTDLERQRVCDDPAATSALGRDLAAAAEPGDLVCLWGELGAGKTHVAKAFGAGLGVTETINSPSFVLMAEYRGRLPLFHIDLYRLADGPTRSPAGSSTIARRPGSRSSSGRTASVTRCRPSASTCASTASAMTPRDHDRGRQPRPGPLRRGASG